MTIGETERDREGVFGLLPDELLPQVFRWLPQSDVLDVVPQVCERWAREATNDKRSILLHVEKDWPLWKKRQALRWKRVRRMTIYELSDWSALVCAVQAKRGVREAEINVAPLLDLVETLNKLSFYRKAPFVTEGKALVAQINKIMECAVAAGMRIELSNNGRYGRCTPRKELVQDWMKRKGVQWEEIRTRDPWPGYPGPGVSRNGDLHGTMYLTVHLPGF